MRPRQAVLIDIVRKETLLLYAFVLIFALFPVFFQWIIYDKEKRDIRRLAKTKEGRVKLVDKVASQLGFYYKGNVQVLRIIDLEKVKKDPLMKEADQEDLVFIYLNSGIRVLYDVENGQIKFAVKENVQ